MASLIMNCVNLSFGRNMGQPTARFMFFLGLLKLEDFSSGMNDSTRLCSGLCGLMRRKVTRSENGQCRRASYSLFIKTKKSEMWVPLPMPSPLRYNLKHSIGYLYVNIALPNFFNGKNRDHIQGSQQS